MCSTISHTKNIERKMKNQIKLRNRSHFISQMSQKYYMNERESKSQKLSQIVLFIAAYLDNNIHFFFWLINKTFTSLFKLSRFWIDNAFSENVLSFYVNIFMCIYLLFAAHFKQRDAIWMGRIYIILNIVPEVEQTYYYWWKWEYVKSYTHTQSMVKRQRNNNLFYYFNI